MTFLQKYILPPLVALFYWLWVHTWRFKLLEHENYKKALQAGPVAFAHWHGDILAVVRLGHQLHCATIASTSSDGELITRVLKLFGFAMARGSSTRSGVRAMVGLLTHVRNGHNPAIAVDGPKGPRHKVKGGIIYLAKHAQIPIIPVGVAKSSALVFNKAWDKSHFPWPFSKVVISFGDPIYLSTTSHENDEAIQLKLEERLHSEKEIAESALQV